MKYSILLLFAIILITSCGKNVELNDREKILLLIVQQSAKDSKTSEAPTISTGTKYDLIEVLADDTSQLYVRSQWLRSSENNALRDAKLPAAFSVYEPLLTTTKQYAGEETIDLENVEKHLKGKPRITHEAAPPEQLMGKVFISYVAIDEANGRALAYVLRSGKTSEGRGGLMLFERNGESNWLLREQIEMEVF